MKTKDAISHFKTKSALAAALRIKPSSIADWGTDVPKQRQYELERITKGALKAVWPCQS
jgi:transcriptional repressor of cell division inhibition gene dicB